MWFDYQPYVSQAERKAMAQRHAAKLAKKGHTCCPVVIEGRKIATSFWGKAWCDHMEAYHDYANRLPRGRTYVRNGSVFDLQIEPGKVRALVGGTEIYEVEISLKRLSKDRWETIKERCAGQVASVVELLQGKFSDAVMQAVTDAKEGLFPSAREFEMDCSCPDGAGMCKHVAAVLYGIGSRLDERPELLFTLRQVDHTELIAAAGSGLARADAGAEEASIAAADLADVFGIEIEGGEETKAAEPVKRPAKGRGKGPKKIASRGKGKARPGVRKGKAG